MKVERLARTLSVTKGSFYWHFKDRSDLLHQTASYWAERQLVYLKTLKDGTFATPEERLSAVLSFIETKDFRHDVAMRLWAKQENWVNELVAEIDEQRLVFCESIFKKMGFGEDEARLRSHLVYYYQVAEQTLSYREPEEIQQRLDSLRYQLLIRPE